MSHRSHKGDEKVNVAVRCRPMFSAEKRLRKAVECKPKEVNVVTGFSTTGLSQAQITKTFTIDKVFGPNSTQLDVYNSVVSPQLKDVLNGYNCTVLAYGQTGTGKTFTMEGERTTGQDFSWDNDPKAGLIPRAMSHLFDFLEDSGCDFSVRVSLLEIYNEEIYDLLSSSNELLKMNIYNDNSRKGSVVVANLTEVHIRHKSEVYDILQQGAIKRRTAATDMNEFSSRSHSVFSVTVHYKEVSQNQMEEEEIVKIGKLNLVDLAGSENIGRSGAVDKRAREAGSINQSLLTLGRCITALVDHSRHVPYRESKLTRLLQDSLGGTTKTSIIATISPGSDNIEETLSTLEYACRAKNIHNRPIVNQKLTKRVLIKQYDDEIERLRREVICLREKNGIHISEEEHEKLTKGAEELQALLHQREVDIAELKALFDTNNSELTETKTKLTTTMEDLETTKSQLSDTQVIKEAHIIRGSRLKSHANELIKVADTVTEDNSRLHDKVARQEDTNHHNLHATKATVQSVQSSVEELRSHSLSVVRESNKEFQQNLNVLESSMERQQGFTSALSQGIQHWQEDITDYMKSNLDLYSELKLKMETKTSTHKEIVNEWKDDLAAIISKTSHKLKAFSKDVGALNSIVEMMHNSTDHYQATLREQMENSKKFEEKMKTEMSVFADDICSIAEQQESHFNSVKDKLQSITEIMGGLQSLTNQTVSSTNKVKTTTHTVTSQYTSDQQSQNSGFIDDLNNDKEKMGMAINGIISTRSEKVVEIDTDLNEITPISDDRELKLLEVCQEMNGEVVLLTDKAAHNSKALDESDHASKLTEMATAESRAHDRDVTTLVTGTTVVMDNNTDITAQLEDRTAEINDELEKLVNEDLRNAAPLGVTPCRKRYHFDRDVARTPGDRTILEDHHQREAEDDSLEPEEESSEENESATSLESVEPDLNGSLTISDTRGQPFFFKRKKKRVEKAANGIKPPTKLPLRQQNH